MFIAVLYPPNIFCNPQKFLLIDLQITLLTSQLLLLPTRKRLGIVFALWVRSVQIRYRFKVRLDYDFAPSITIPFADVIRNYFPEQIHQRHTVRKLIDFAVKITVKMLAEKFGF